MMKAVIMAGGRGTRIASVNSEIPKPMLKINGKPVLEHQIDCLKKQGISDITLIVGHLGNVIKQHFGDSVKYITEEAPLGTAGALYYLKNDIKSNFILINGDVIFDVDINRFEQFHRDKNALITLFAHPNNHPYDSGVLVTDTEERVTAWFAKEDPRTWYRNLVNAGLHIISPNLLEQFSEPKKTDLDRDVITPLIPNGRVFAYNSPEYVKDMGTPERMKETERDLKIGLAGAKNLANKQKALFIDRDGTINKYVGFLTQIDTFELISETVDIIKKANQDGRLVIVVTNQPVIARGDITWEELHEIHNKMETLLGKKGAYVNDIFICPHHPDKGFEGERPEYKIDCDCRKPKPGLLFQAARKYNIDLSKSTMIGDSKADMQAGIAAGCETIRI